MQDLASPEAVFPCNTPTSSHTQTGWSRNLSGAALGPRSCSCFHGSWSENIVRCSSRGKKKGAPLQAECRSMSTIGRLLGVAQLYGRQKNPEELTIRLCLRHHLKMVVTPAASRPQKSGNSPVSGVRADSSTAPEAPPHPPQTQHQFHCLCLGPAVAARAAAVHRGIASQMQIDGIEAKSEAWGLTRAIEQQRKLTQGAAFPSA